jgi:hypothetical protein
MTPYQPPISSQSDRWCILKIIILSTRKNKNRFFFVKKWGMCKCRGVSVTMFSSIFYPNMGIQEINPSFYSASERRHLGLQNESLTNIGRCVHHKLEGGCVFFLKYKEDILRRNAMNRASRSFEKQLLDLKEFF